MDKLSESFPRTRKGLMSGSHSFHAVLQTFKIVNFLTMSSDQRERVLAPVRQHRFGWRPCRPVRSTARLPQPGD